MNKKTYSGRQTTALTENEIKHRKVARMAASEGIVLLENSGVLPLDSACKIALYGAGARKTVKGGTGSGDVNQRDVVSVEEGLVKAGFEIASQPWLDDYDQDYDEARERWKNQIISQSDGTTRGIIRQYASHPFQFPSGRPIETRDYTNAEDQVAIYVLSRTAGEGRDRENVEGDYLLTAQEKDHLISLSNAYSSVILIINSGGMVDLSPLDDCPVDALIYMSQAGMEAGSALADLISGGVTPSGKMTDTWALTYQDYPTSDVFSLDHSKEETYIEGIYVGYRYFDTFKRPVRYPFAYGLSYTSFTWQFDSLAVEEEGLLLHVKVKNTGTRYKGKEVIQAYVAYPSQAIDREVQALVAFQKTKCLDPSEIESLNLKIDYRDLAYFSHQEGAWKIEKGIHEIYIGNHSRNRQKVCELVFKESWVISEVQKLYDEEIKVTKIKRPQSPVKLSQNKENVPQFECCWHDHKKQSHVSMDMIDSCVQAKLSMLNDEELTELVIGMPSDAAGTIGAASFQVPGAAGESNHAYTDSPYEIPYIVLADGPAGLRLKKHYQVDENGSVKESDMLSSIEGGLFSKEVFSDQYEDYYQYCTAMPVGTLLAQSFNPEVMTVVGETVAEEMLEYGIDIWLAPGMNIHRDPLCGRNYEYYSEDPLLTGVMASALVKGVQKNPRLGTAIKHFACNNCEDNRKESNSIISERALREIYLKGFEKAVKEAKPKMLMTSYNLINGVYAANHYGLCTQILREEWGFEGVVLSDWTTTHTGGADAAKCILAGNDLIMPGYEHDKLEILESLYKHRQPYLRRDFIEKSASRIVKLAMECSEG